MNDRPNGSPPPPQPRALLQRIARRVMVERGLEPDFSPAAVAELAAIQAPEAAGAAVRDLRGLLWCSIDNDDSRDLDQLSVAEALPDDAVRLMVAIADVTGLVRRGTALDRHAEHNTTSVYTAAEIFPMLPEKLSTDLTSLNMNEDRRAVVVEMVFNRAGTLTKSDVFEAQVRNHAQLAYNGVAAWLEGTTPLPPRIAAVPGLDDNIRLQVGMAQQLKALRHARGALSFETIQARPVFTGGVLTALEADTKNTAKELIEDLMVAANGVVAQFLAAKKFPSLRRVVRTPEHWDRIVELAALHGTALPPVADAVALENFLVAARTKDPARFPDLSLSIIKLMGAGEYVVELPGGHAPGHFGLAVRHYSHSTAPNRRFPDVITQRLLKAALAGRPPPYENEELAGLALHCTEQEDAAKKVERTVGKSAAAMLLTARIGETFDAMVTGASDKGTWVRLSQPPVEGKLVSGSGRLKVGDRVRVKLLRTEVERGFIDFSAT